MARIKEGDIVEVDEASCGLSRDQLVQVLEAENVLDARLQRGRWWRVAAAVGPPARPRRPSTGRRDRLRLRRRSGRQRARLLEFRLIGVVGTGGDRVLWEPRGEDDLVSGDPLVVADKGHIHELVVIAQLAHAVDDVGLVVSPLDAELCARHGQCSLKS